MTDMIHILVVLVVTVSLLMKHCCCCTFIWLWKKFRPSSFTLQNRRLYCRGGSSEFQRHLSTSVLLHWVHIKFSLNFLKSYTYFLGKLLHVKDQDHVLAFSWYCCVLCQKWPLGLYKVFVWGITSFFTQSNVPFLRQSKFNIIILLSFILYYL